MAGMKATVIFIGILQIFLLYPGTKGTKLKLRLSNGPNQYEGRVEVLFNNTWGTICDDNWQDAYCAIVCRQLGFTGGKLVEGSNYGQCSGPIWLDDVKCTGLEASLDQCMMSQKHNCDHSEDVGCRCEAPGINTGVLPSTCDSSLYRIKPLSSERPWIGRAEIRRTSASAWQVICDDYWTDINAQVFCHCLGYTGPYYAYSTIQIGHMLPQLSMAYDWVKCMDTNVGHNLDECPHGPATGRCHVTEAAGVACGPVQHQTIPHAPDATLTCDGKALVSCFTVSEYQMSSLYLTLTPSCAKASRYDITNGVCYNVDMTQCKAVQLKSDENHKHYCYDISYSQYDDNPQTLLMDSVWTRRACCSVFKNGTVDSSFSPLIPVSAPIFKRYTDLNAFSMTCHKDDKFSGPAITLSDTLIRGQDISCKVTANIWDSDLLLVVPECQFSVVDRSSADNLGKPTFTFISKKCPTTTDLGLSYFNFDSKTWGYQFQVPKFQGYNQLFVTCSTYVCDEKLDVKPYCDRSCLNNNRRRRSVTEHTNINDTVNDELTLGPFNVLDEGFGPLIYLSTGVMSSSNPAALHNIHLPRPKVNQSEVILKPASSHSNRNCLYASSTLMLCLLLSL